jgi:cyclophilin family peptidyl-prolyl cis-trans isomerase/HEAT repeat protein
VIRHLVWVTLVVSLGTACVPDGPRPDFAARAEARLLEAEDSREVLLGASALEDARARLTAVRALGRLEDPSLVPEIAASLTDPDDAVRAAAIEALAQAVHGSDGSSVLERLLERVPLEQDPVVRGELAHSIGRLTLDAAERRRAVEALVALSSTEAGDDSPPGTLLGVALGFEALTRALTDEGLSGEAGSRLERMASIGRDDGEVLAARIRPLALTALARARRMSLELVEAGSADPEPEVRRTVLRYLDAIVPSRRPGFLDAALADPSPRVVLEALRIVAAGPRNESGCERLLAAATSEVDPAVRVVALTALGRPCPARAPQVAALRAAASELPPGVDGPWQPAARAFVSLARVDAPTARGLLSRFADHSSAFVRVYAAQAAGILDDRAALRALARDSSPNARNAALEALFAVEGHAIDEQLLAQLSGDDPQLLITVARLLAGSPRHAEVAVAVVEAFERISTARRETWRDPRVALLARASELGDRGLASRLEPFLADYDPVVADTVAVLLRRWTGGTREAEPAPLPREPLPSTAELAELSRSTVTLHMRGDGQIVIDLLTDLAPRNAWRFARLARAGYFDGLTFHRWEPNFVIQGGSPGANEYAGDGPYTRDEVGATHWRGTVGVSTRGRDTGDGQIFINLVDNVRLDHEYTVFGFVTEGMDVVDRVLEGAVIERAEVRAAN